MIYAYIRVSTDKQNNENQRFQICDFCKQKNLKTDEWIAETISSRVVLEKRKLSVLLGKLKEKDIVIACEISRFGRNLLEVMEILSYCIKVGCQVWTIKDNYRLGVDIQSKVLAFAFALSAEIERQLISQRTKQSLERLKSEGCVLGRKKGALNKKYNLDGKVKKIKELKDFGLSDTALARQLKCSRATLVRFYTRNRLRFH